MTRPSASLDQNGLSVTFRFSRRKRALAPQPRPLDKVINKASRQKMMVGRVGVGVGAAEVRRSDQDDGARARDAIDLLERTEDVRQMLDHAPELDHLEGIR